MEGRRRDGWGRQTRHPWVDHLQTKGGPIFGGTPERTTDVCRPRVIYKQLSPFRPDFDAGRGEWVRGRVGSGIEWSLHQRQYELGVDHVRKESPTYGVALPRQEQQPLQPGTAEGAPVGVERTSRLCQCTSGTKGGDVGGTTGSGPGLTKTTVGSSVRSSLSDTVTGLGT